MSDLINENERKAFLPEFPEDKIKRLEAENKRLTYDLGKCREGSVIRTRINDKQVMRIEQLEGALVKEFRRRGWDGDNIFEKLAALKGGDDE